MNGRRQMKRYGLDFIHDRIIISGLTEKEGAFLAEAPIAIPLSELRHSEWDPAATVCFSIPEEHAIIKRVRIPASQNMNADELARFEMAASLLDSPDRFHMESYGANGTHERLVVAYDRRGIDEKLSLLEGYLSGSPCFRLRSLALAVGYMKYCRYSENGLICLADISANRLSYCFIREGHPVLAGGFKFGESTGEKVLSSASFFDLVAVLKYQMAMISVSSGRVSSLIISGESADADLASHIEQHIQIKISLPELKKELFLDQPDTRISKYLVGLGLTACIK